MIRSYSGEVMVQKRSKKTQKYDFTVVLALFTEFWNFGKFGEFLARADKIGLG